MTKQKLPNHRQYLGLFIVMVMLYLMTPLPGQNRNLRFKRISLDEGLSQSRIYSIIQDRKGFMWFGTQDGLNKYDGYSFTVYHPDPEKPNCLSDSTINSLLEDKEGKLWAGTYAGGLNRFDQETETFTHFKHRPGDPTSLSQNFVSTLCIDNSGIMWVGTAYGLNRFHPGTGTFTRYFQQPGTPGSLSSNKILCLYEDRSGTLWIGTEGGGLNRMDRKRFTFSHFTPEPGNPHSIQSGTVNSIFEDHSGELWVATANGLHRLNRETGVFTVYQNNPARPGSISCSNIGAVHEDRSGVLWVATLGGGLSVFDRRKETFTHYRHILNDPTSLGGDFPRIIYEDRSGALWIGTSDSGISLFDRQREKFNLYRHSSNHSKSLNANHVWAIREDRNGVLWIGTKGGGLNKYDRRTEMFTHYRTDPSNPESLSSDNIFSLHIDDRGFIWTGTFDNGLNRFDPLTETSTRYLTIPGDPSSLGFAKVKTLFEDSKGVLWVGFYEGGLDKFNRETETFSHYRFDSDTSNNLSHNAVMSLLEDPPGYLWVGTSVRGLRRMNIADGTFTSYYRDRNNPNSPQFETVMSIYRDTFGNLWLGTFSCGLVRFEADSETFTYIREKNGLPSNVVYGILADDRERLWVSTNKGISCFDPRTGFFKNYTPSDGLQSNEFGSGVFFKNTKGEMFFGGIKGFNSFLPDEIVENKHIPPILLTEFQVFNHPQSIGNDSPLQRHITETGRITLSHNQHVFSFKFVALNYTIPEKNRYRYMLEGFDKDWIAVDSSQRYAAYTNMEPGNYTFRVLGSNNDGVWNETGASVEIVITPPFWQTWWFRLPAVLFMVAFIGILFQMRIRNISQKTRMETELLTAHNAQMSIMPQKDPEVPGFDISGICVPAHEVGGDFFDYLWLEPGGKKFGIAIGDVSGKSMQAAMTAVMASGMLNSRALCATSIEEIMTQLNRPLYLKTDKKMFTALCLASLDVENKEMIFANAGLCEPILKSSGSVSYLDSVGPRLPLGTFVENRYRAATVPLKPGDVVLLYTDGLPEAQTRGGNLYGYETLQRFVEVLDTASLSAARIKADLIDRVTEFSGSAPQFDDMTVVVIKVL